MSNGEPSRAATIAALVAQRTAGWDDTERAALQAVLTALKPSASHVRDILDWLDDIAVREHGRPAAALADPELAAIARGPGSSPDRLKRWKERLKRLRYPRLAAREAAVADQIRALDLGTGIAVSTPPALEGDAIAFTIRARSPQELAAALDRLRSRIARGDVDRLFALLDDA